MKGKQLLEHLREDTKVLKSKNIEEALVAIDRASFVPEELKDEAYEDYALPIGHGQTISQPTTVVFMLELLGAQEGEKILDVGSGSGWTTALLSNLVGESGSVLGLERVPELVEMGQKNLTRTSRLSRLNLDNVRIEQAGEELGRVNEGPYDRILVSATTAEIPKELVQQLRGGGVMVIPVGDSICQITRESDGYRQKCYPGFVFVPLVS